MRMLTENQLTGAALEFGTPLFLYDAECIQQKYTELRQLLDASCDIYYSMKANPTVAICQYLNKLGSNCEVSSINELLTALRSNFKSDQIIFVGPGKSKEEIEIAIEKNIKSIICESIEEIEMVNAISKKYQRKTSILIRINPDFFVAKSPIKMSGVPTQFGIELYSLKKHLHSVKQYRYISIDGIQIYNASRVLDEAALIENIQNILTLSNQLADEFSLHWKIIDIGGGFGIPYYSNEKALSSVSLIEKINTLFKKYRDVHPHTRFIIELGRYLVSESGYLISTIQSIKENHEKKYIIVNAGMHCHLAATGLGSFVHRNFPMLLISQSEEKSKNCLVYSVAGPLCTPGDVLLKDVQLPDAHVGDLLVLRNVGAYGLSASPGRFLSFGSPAEAILLNNKSYCIRRRETVDDIWSTQYTDIPLTAKTVNTI
jgi:diaminopimelate decarboxylase